MKQWKLLKPLSKKVVAVVYEMWSFTKGSSCVISRENVLMFWIGAVPDPDLEIREVWGGGGGVGQPNPEIRGGRPVVQNFFFGLSGPSLV